MSSVKTRTERTFDPDTVRKLKAGADHDLTVDGLASFTFSDRVCRRI
ncbi:hypothetical protein ACIBBB_33280 [Streptomyces sp. NPDC051217]